MVLPVYPVSRLAEGARADQGTKAQRLLMSPLAHALKLGPQCIDALGASEVRTGHAPDEMPSLPLFDPDRWPRWLPNDG